MPTYRRSRDTIVAAPQKLCFEVLTDYERSPEWQGPVKRADVLERYDDGLAAVVAYEIDAKVRTVHYTLRHRYDAPRCVTSDFVEGDLEHVAGEWTFEPHEDAEALVTFSMEIDPGRFVPRPIARMLETQVMGAALDDLRREAERVVST